MNNFFVFALAVIFVAINGLTQLSYAYGMGFKLKPTGISFIVASAMGLLTGSVTPLSGQAAMLTITGKILDLQERSAALILSSIFMIAIGLTGGMSAIVTFAGPAVVAGMMAGVGLILAEVGGVSMFKSNYRVGAISIITALLMWGWTRDLVYTVAASVTLSTLDYLFIQKKRVQLMEDVQQTDEPKFWTKAYWQTEDWKIVVPKFNVSSILGALAILCLGIGATSSFGNINASISGIPQNLDRLTFMTGIADLPGILFGGAPLEAIISGTAAAPWPVMGAVIMMLLLGTLLISGSVIKICKYIPMESIAGFLLVIGTFSTFLPNISNAFATGNTAQASIAMGVTVITKNPFLGMLCGVLIRYIGAFWGLAV
ncbi:MAG: hypothetical protein FWF59_11580 [Turicibacter sp.]|nr:hypothetical protein [Turicibacter sp.]